jgi:cysteine sulfinate desulfinase/cysteine desulfurase-like protein
MTYLDHAATTPMLPEAVAVMSAALARTGNASSVHSAGRAARRLVEESRESIAAGLGARPSDVVFTGGGSEGDNQAAKGIYWARRTADLRRTRVLVSATEHHAVLAAAPLLAMGADEAVARGSLRFSLGHTSTPADVAAVAWVIGPVVERARRAGYAGSRQTVSAAGSTGGR